MPIANLSYVTVTGTFLDGDGDPETGRVVFELRARRVSTIDQSVISPTRVEVTLDANGAFSTSLPCTDDPDFLPVDTPWTVTERIGETYRTYQILLPAADSPVDLADIAPFDPVDGSRVYVRYDAPRQIVNIATYGGVCDGVTDDRAAMDDALAACWAAADEGKHPTLFLPGPTFVTGVFISGSEYAAVVVERDNFTITGSELVTDAREPFVLNGRVKEGNGYGDFFNATLGLSSLTYYTIHADGVAEGATRVRLATAAEAANFAVGDDIFIRTGECLPVVSGNSPDAELNKVTSVDAGTGYIGLQRRTAKPYLQEYWSDVTETGPTTTAVTAYPATFAVANVTARMLRNFTLDCDVRVLDSALAHGSHRPVVYVFWCDGVRIRNVTMDGPASLIAGRNTVNVNASGVRLRSRIPVLTVSGDRGYQWLIGPSTGCGNWTVTDCEWTGNGGPFLHLHEGTFNITFRNNRVLLSDVPASVDMERKQRVSLTSRVYNADISGNVWEGAYLNNGRGVLMQGGNNAANGSTSKSRFSHNIVRGEDGYDSLCVAATESGWVIEGNDWEGYGTLRTQAPVADNTIRNNIPASLNDDYVATSSEPGTIRQAVAAQDTSTSHVISFNGVTVEGNLLLACLATSSNNIGDITIPSGWTRITDATYDAGTDITVWCYKEADGTENTVTWTLAVSAVAGVQLLEVVGVTAGQALEFDTSSATTATSLALGPTSATSVPTLTVASVFLSSNAMGGPGAPWTTTDDFLLKSPNNNRRLGVAVRTHETGATPQTTIGWVASAARASGIVFTLPLERTVSNLAYGAGWDGVTDVAPSKNAVYDIGIRKGTGSPEGVVTAGVGAIYLRTDGGAGTSMYVKESGAGNTGWVAK